MNGCDHTKWVQSDHHPLACEDCGETLSSVLTGWEPYTKPDGYGLVAVNHIPWKQRVDTVVAELRKIA